MAAINTTIVSTALNSIRTGLDAGVAWSGWTITIYSLGQVVVMPVAGKLSDMYGRKRIFLAAIVLFTTTSLVCGLVNNIYLLVVLRAIQAVGGGTFMPSASGIVADSFGPSRDRAIGMFTTIFPAGGIVGPILGGVLVTFWSWHGIFLVNVPIGAALIILIVIFVPESAKTTDRRIDFYGITVMGMLILAAMTGVTFLGGGHTVFDVRFVAPELIAVIALVLFVRHAKHGREPFIPIWLLSGHGFGTMNVINFIFGAAVMGFGALVPLYAETRFSIPTLQAGTLLTARAVGMIAVAAIATMALRRTGYRIPMFTGFGLLAIGTFGIALVPDGHSPYLWLSMTAGLVGLGVGLAQPASNNATLQLAPDQVAGITGMRGMFRQSGGIIAVSIATAVSAQTDHPGHALGYVFLTFAVVVIAVLPLTLRVPEHRGAW